MSEESSPPDSTSDPVMQAFEAKVMRLLAERAAAFGIPPDMESRAYWVLMTCSFVLERLVAEHRPPAKGKKSKPRRWSEDEDRRIIRLVEEATAGGKKAGGKTVSDAVKTLVRSGRVFGDPESVPTRYYEAKRRVWNAQRDAIVKALLSQPKTPPAGPTDEGQ